MREEGRLLEGMKQRGELAEGRPKKLYSDDRFFSLYELDITFVESSFCQMLWQTMAMIVCQSSKTLTLLSLNLHSVRCFGKHQMLCMLEWRHVATPWRFTMRLRMNARINILPRPFKWTRQNLQSSVPCAIWMLSAIAYRAVENDSCKILAHQENNLNLEREFTRLPLAGFLLAWLIVSLGKGLASAIHRLRYGISNRIRQLSTPNDEDY